VNSQYISFFYESGISITVLYLFYFLFLRKDTFHNLNRLYLLTSILFSFILPLLKFNLFSQVSEAYDFVSRISNPGNISTNSINLGLYENNSNVLHWTKFLSYLYLAGVCYFTIRFISGVLKIIKLARTGDRKTYKEISVIFTKQDFAPFSFLNMIFINKALIKEDQLDEIIDHECIHAKQYHSIDLLIMELFLIIQWFNPVVWLVRKSLKETHEYIADSEIVKKGYDRRNYHKLLLCCIKGVRTVKIANEFNRFLLKSRIRMMMRPQSPKPAILKFIFSIPLMILILAIFSCSGSRNNTVQTAVISVPEPEHMVPDPNDTTNYAEMIFFTVDEMPTFQEGTIYRFQQYVKENVKIPKGIIENKSFTIFAQFVVTTEGEIEKAQIITPVHPDIDSEVLRVINSCPKWKPGKQSGYLTNVAYTTRFDISIK